MRDTGFMGVNVRLLVVQTFGMLAISAVLAIGWVNLSGVTNEIRTYRHQQCLDANERHDATVAALNTVLRAAARQATPAVRRRLPETRAATLFLIDSLVPARNCNKL